MKSKKKIVSTSFALLMALGGISAFMPKSFADSEDNVNTEIKAEDKKTLIIKKGDFTKSKSILTITAPKDGFVKDKNYEIAYEDERAILPDEGGYFSGKIVNSKDKEIGSVSLAKTNATIKFSEVDEINKSIKDGLVEFKLKDVKGVSDARERDKALLEKVEALKNAEEAKNKALKSFETYKNSDVV